MVKARERKIAVGTLSIGEWWHLYEELCDEASWLLGCWRLYRQIYGDRKTVETIREAAPFFFGSVQKLLREGVLLSVQRLLDASGSHDARTASLESLLQSTDAQPHEVAILRKLKKDLQTLRTKAETIKQLRHRQIAHLDLRTVLLKHPAPLGQVTVQTMNSVVTGIADWLNEFGRQFYKTAVSVEVGEIDGDTMVFLLELGLKNRPVINFPIKE